MTSTAGTQAATGANAMSKAEVGVGAGASNSALPAAASVKAKKQQHTMDTLRPLLKTLTLSCTIPFSSSSSTSSAPSDEASSSSSKAPTGMRPPGPALTEDQLRDLFVHLADAEFTSNNLHHAQLGAALTTLRLSGLDSSPAALSVASSVFLEKALPVQVPPLAPSNESTPKENDDADEEEDEDAYTGALDLVGTGGDGHDTFNVSTTAAILAAGVPGVRVCKHGARASSSTSGSADLLASLGVPLASLTPSNLPHLLAKSPFCFLFAQLYHPSLAPLAPIRRSLAFPTIFNVLGPLINPARPRRSIIGVHSPGLGNTFAEALRQMSVERAWVVCGREGLDEISPAGPTDVWELRSGKIEYFSIEPASFGLQAHPLEKVRSGTSGQNAAVARLLLTGQAEALIDDAEKGQGDKPTSAEIRVEGISEAIPAGTHLAALRDYVLLQAAALLYVGGKAKTLLAATQRARKSMASGAGARALDVLIAQSQEIQQREAHEAEARNAVEKRKKEEREGLEKTKSNDEFFYSPEPTKDANVGTTD